MKRSSGLMVMIVCSCGTGAAWTGSPAWAQSTQRAAFTANNGNLEGSITAYRVEINGALTFVNKVVTGTRTTLNDPCPGCNAYSISLTPNGHYLGVSHAPGDPRGLSILSVAPNATVSFVMTLTLAGNTWSPLAVRWLSDQYLAVSRTDSSGVNNGVSVYQFNPGGPSLSLVDSKSIPGFSSYLEVHPNRQFLIAQATGPNAVWVYQINNNGTLTFLNSYSNTYYPLGQGLSPDGTKLYAGGGISGSSHIISGWNVNPATGVLAPMSGTPFTSTGTSPKQVVVSSDNLLAFASHGTTSNVRSFTIDQATGTLTQTAFSFSVGIQGSMGEIAVLDNLLLVCDRDTIGDGVKGLYSLKINSNGSFTQNGLIVDSQGTVGPNAVVAWKPLTPPCPADIATNGVVDVDDLLYVITLWGTCRVPPPGCVADIVPPGGNGIVDVDDLLAVVNAWGPCP